MEEVKKSVRLSSVRQISVCRYVASSSIARLRRSPMFIASANDLFPALRRSATKTRSAPTERVLDGTGGLEIFRLSEASSRAGTQLRLNRSLLQFVDDLRSRLEPE